MSQELPIYTINITQNPSVDEMMNAIREFYPLGKEIKNTSFNGYQVLCDIISVKINHLIEGMLPIPFDQLVLDVEKAFLTFNVVKETERQFPNYALSIELSKQNLVDFLIVKSLKVRVSLITNFFTIFHEEMIIHKGVSSFNTIHAPVITTLLSGLSNIVDENGKHFNNLKDMVGYAFPHHKFVDHYLLFALKLKNAVPHGFLDDQYGMEFPLYNFLFDYDFVDPSSNKVVP